MKNRDIIILSVLLVALVATRVILNTPNFNPVGAIALMGGLLFGRKLIAYIIPLGLLLLGDFLLGVLNPQKMEYFLSTYSIFQYVSFALIITLGIFMMKKPSFTKVLGGSLIAAVLFFLVTNAGSWLMMPEYTKDFSGLMTSYKAGLIFFRATLTSQVIFGLGIYTVYSLSTNRKLALA
jgi:hypothetical protein